MAVPFNKIPGAQERSLVNTVPGLRADRKRGRRIYGPVLGISKEVEERRKKIGRALGWTSLVLSLLFVIGGICRVNILADVLGQDRVQMVFVTLGVVSAMGVHLFLFAAEALRGRDAPRAVMALLVFWTTFIMFGLW